MSGEMELTGDTNASVENVSATNDSVTEVQAQDAPSEKMIPQSQVNAIVGKARQEAADRARRELEQSREQSHTPQLGGMKAMSQDEINRMIDQRVEERTHKAYAEQLITDFTGKLKAGAEKHPDFDQVVSELNLPANPALVRWTNGLDNTADVLYDLGKHPEKYANVVMLSNTAPAMAQSLLKRLSDSVKKNEEAVKSERNVNEPLDHLKPSPTGMDSGNLTVSDLRKQDWLRG